MGWARTSCLPQHRSFWVSLTISPAPAAAADRRQSLFCSVSFRYARGCVDREAKVTLEPSVRGEGQLPYTAIMPRASPVTHLLAPATTDTLHASSHLQAQIKAQQISTLLPDTKREKNTGETGRFREKLVQRRQI